MSKFIYDRYIVKLPGDMFERIEDYAEQAITEAKERTKLYCVPAEWRAVLISGNNGDHELTFRVTRKRNRSK